jgi:hypothetical protein
MYHVYVRSAYLYWMAQLLYSGRQEEATGFHQLLQQTFFDLLDYFPYISTDHKFKINKAWGSTRGVLHFVRIPLVFKSRTVVDIPAP